jgi:hypothetical protein
VDRALVEQAHARGSHQQASSLFLLPCSPGAGFHLRANANNSVYSSRDGREPQAVPLTSDRTESVSLAHHQRYDSEAWTLAAGTMGKGLCISIPHLDRERTSASLPWRGPLDTDQRPKLIVNPLHKCRIQSSYGAMQKSFINSPKLKK